MADDIGPILRKWHYSANDMNVRLIQGEDGRQKLQLRLDLGLLQMELDGRPDGRRPHHFESYYSYYLHKSRLAEKEEARSLNLTPFDCWLLQQEAIQLYHRYVALMRLGDFGRVLRDTKRNLQLFDFVGSHSSNETIIWSFEQYRPYVIMMNTRAAVSQCMEFQDYDKALEQIRKGRSRLRRFYRMHGEKAGDERVELELLQEWAVEIRSKRPISDRDQLARELRRAVRSEDYERA
ncbi:MAG TPA: hypothetical protein PKM23_01895, partial [bacterium]|nr:hypothetical protein [bacterium]